MICLIYSNETRLPVSEIQAERAHLAAARAALNAMHKDVVTTETPKSGAEDNDDYVVNLYYKWARNRRADALVDRPDVPLFFGRLDYEPGIVFDRDKAADGAVEETGKARENGVDRIYVGRRHVHEPGGVPLVIDWRAPIAVPFYRAIRGDRRGVLLRRRYGFSDDAELTAYEDEPLSRQAEPHLDDGSEPVSELVTAEIERPRAGIGRAHV